MADKFVLTINSEENDDWMKTLPGYADEVKIHEMLTNERPDKETAQRVAKEEQRLIELFELREGEYLDEIGDWMAEHETDRFPLELVEKERQTPNEAELEQKVRDLFDSGYLYNPDGGASLVFTSVGEALYVLRKEMRDHK